ncbi:MAG: 5-formyltetrahydrofolate cyclo-ligase [Alicyclobacillus sp.]|nr:5-formyltetrahydrofolate cyclo-ligase [Alicyclobacillus sp.]
MAYRQRYLKLRADLTEADRVALSKDIRAHLLSWLATLCAPHERAAVPRGHASAPRERAAASPEPMVALYAATRGEVDVLPMLPSLVNMGCRAAAPRTYVAKKALQFHLVNPSTRWVTGAYGIREPDADAGSEVLAEELCVILVPGVAFTREGGRIGYGGGYYDRFLQYEAPQALRVGVCFGVQVAATLPLEPHDIRMTHLVTEVGVTVCGPA